MVGVFPEEKSSQTISDEFSNTLCTSKQKPNKIEGDRCEEFHNKIFQKLMKVKNIRTFSRFSDKGPSIRERFN